MGWGLVLRGGGGGGVLLCDLGELEEMTWYILEVRLILEGWGFHCLAFELGLAGAGWADWFGLGWSGRNFKFVM